MTHKPMTSPWLAVNLSFFFAGVGQICTGFIWRGMMIVFIQLVLIAGALYHLFLPSGSTLLAIGSGFGFLLIHAMNLFDIYELLCPPHNKNTKKTRRGLSLFLKRKGGEKTMIKPDMCRKDIWYAVFLSRIFPPWGLFHNRQYIACAITFILLIGIGIIRMQTLYAILLIPVVTTGACYFLLHHSSVKNVFNNHIKSRFILILLLATLCVHYVPFLLFKDLTRPFFIPSISMAPKLKIGDRILVKPHPPEYQRGDIVVFRHPVDDQLIFCKRVVAFGGETIEIKKGLIWINGRPRKQESSNPVQYISIGKFGGTGDPFLVPRGHVFVLGDNSANSYDSRNYGPIPADMLIGRAFKIYWPISRQRPL